MPPSRFQRFAPPFPRPAKSALRSLAAPLLVVLAACSEPAPPPAAAEALPPADVVIEMTDGMRFEPAHLRVAPGTVIEWVNRGHMPHTATIRAGNEPLERRPAGAEVFDSGLLHPGERFRVRLSVAGEYRYVCTLHLASDMTAGIEVIDLGEAR